MANPAVTEQQLAWIVETIAKLYLEVERGLRPPEQLRRFLTPQMWAAHQQQPMTSFPRGGPVLERDLGQVRLSLIGDRRVFAAIPTREEHQRWGALLLQLEADPHGRWQITELQRLTPRLVERDSPQPQPEPRDPAASLQALGTERRLVRAAREQVSAARTSAPAGQRRALDQELALWNRRASDLDREAQALTARLRARDELATPQSENTLMDPPSYLTRMLGPQPTSAPSHHVWLACAGLVEGYRDRWNITDPHTPVPPAGADPTQREDRVATLERLGRLSGHLQPEHTLDGTHDTPPALELGL